MPWTKAHINAMLDGSDKAVMKGLMQLYARQTASERSTQLTTDANGVGFNYHDSKVLSDIASRVPRYGRLTPAQTSLVRGRLRKYWRQLMDIANESGKEPPQWLDDLVRGVPARAVQPVPLTDKDVEDMAARAEEAQAVDAWIARAGLVAAGDHV